MALLEAKGLGIRFGGLKAVDEFNFEIEENQSVWIDWSKWCR